MTTKMILPLLIVLSISGTVLAQSKKTSVVEHFTNTRCSICASRNPSFYGTLNNHPDVLHIAFHPSSPYNKCVFSQQNPIENDDRTKYYNAYGSTPKAFLNGKQSSQGATLITDTAIEKAQAMSSPLEIEVTQSAIENNNVTVQVTIKSTGSISDSLLIFVGILENPVNYTAPNGETVHHDVFRKAITNATGNEFSAANLGETTTLSFTYVLDANWIAGNVYAIAYIQNKGTKEIINGAKSESLQSTTSINNRLQINAIYPNPVNGTLFLNNNNVSTSTPNTLSIYNTLGVLVYQKNQFTGNSIDVSSLSKGIYFLNLQGSNTRFIKD